MDEFLTYLYRKLFEAEKAVTDHAKARKQPRVGYSTDTIDNLLAEAKVSKDVAGKVRVTAEQFIDAYHKADERLWEVEAQLKDMNVLRIKNTIDVYMSSNYRKA